MTKTALLLLTMLTMMSGTAIVASLPLMSAHFATIDNIELLSKLLLTLPALMVAIFSPLSGYIIDTTGRLRSVYIGLLLFVVGGALGFFVENFWFILAGRAIMGVGVAFLMTASTALIGDYFQGESRHKFMGLQSAFNGIGGIIFISGGGFLAAISWKHPFLIYLLPLLFLPILFKGLYEPAKVKHHSDEIDARLFEKRFIVIYLAAFGMMNLFYILPTQVPFLLSNHYDQSPAQVGTMIAFAMFMSALAAMQYKRLRSLINVKAIFGLLFVLFGIGVTIMSQAHSMTVFYVGAMFNGLGMGMMMVNLNAWMLESAPEKLRGRITGMTVSFIFLGQFTSPIFSQTIIALWDLPTLFLFLGVASIFLGLFLGLFRRGHHAKKL